jgi:hypothetical protein
VSGEGLNKLAAEQVVDEIRRAGGQAIADHGSGTTGINRFSNSKAGWRRHIPTHGA